MFLLSEKGTVVIERQPYKSNHVFNGLAQRWYIEGAYPLMSSMNQRPVAMADPYGPGK